MRGRTATIAYIVKWSLGTRTVVVRTPRPKLLEMSTAGEVDGSSGPLTLTRYGWRVATDSSPKSPPMTDREDTTAGNPQLPRYCPTCGEYHAFDSTACCQGPSQSVTVPDRQTVTVGERTVTIIDGLVFVDMGEQGWMPPIYAQSTSPGHVTSVTEIVRTLLSMQTERDAEKERRVEAEKVVDATDTITPVMCADSRVPDWHRLRLRDIVEARNLYRSLTPEVPHE